MKKLKFSLGLWIVRVGVFLVNRGTSLAASTLVDMYDVEDENITIYAVSKGPLHRDEFDPEITTSIPEYLEYALVLKVTRGGNDKMEEVNFWYVNEEDALEVKATIDNEFYPITMTGDGEFIYGEK